MRADDRPTSLTGIDVLGRRWLCSVGVASAVVLLIASGCGGSGEGSASDSSATKAADCGETSDVLAGEYGGSAGGKAYLDVDGTPVVSRAGRGTYCRQLLALADAYERKHGTDLLRWLDRHTWIWMNRDAAASKYSTFDLDTNDVFIGTRPGQRSQVAFRTG
jgi:hypothetical protein